MSSLLAFMRLLNTSRYLSRSSSFTSESLRKLACGAATPSNEFSSPSSLVLLAAPADYLAKAPADYLAKAPADYLAKVVG